MILKRILTAVLFTTAIANAGMVHAQKEATVWYFGYKAGFDFNGGNPVTLSDGVMKLSGSGAVISDKDTGELLFYTDGRNFWNRQHVLMPSSNFLPSECYTWGTQPAVIVPDSENSYLFNVFCLRLSNEYVYNPDGPCAYAPRDSSLWQLYHVLVDMRLDNGRGDIVAGRSNVLIQTDVTEKLTAVPHANGKDYWVLVHGWNSNRFYAYPLSSTAVGSPVITDIGSAHQVRSGIYRQDILQEQEGEMKASPNGKKIACGVWGELRPFDLFDFDAATGTLSNYINLGNLRGQYGLSFSPDNSKLYMSTDSPPNQSLKYFIFQFDLNAGDPAAIAASGQSIIINNPYANIPANGIPDGFSSVYMGFQLGLDGRLYVTSNNSSQPSSDPSIVVVIDQPNKKGFDCQLSYRYIDFGEGRTGVGLPNFMQSYFNNIESITVCDRPTSISFYPNPTPDKIKIDVLQGCPQTYSLEIINVLGQRVFSQTEIGTATEVDISSFASGLYFFRVITPGRAVVVTKIVKV